MAALKEKLLQCQMNLKNNSLKGKMSRLNTPADND